jgi:DNA-binding GntR family transcriptional regulator
MRYEILKIHNLKYMSSNNNKNRSLSINVHPLQKPRSLNHLAYETLKNSILNGKLVAGEIYSELELARTLGISRTPVREALLRLAAENIIIFHSRKGMSVNYFSKKDVEDLFELREAVEGTIVTKLAGHLNKEQIRVAENILAEQERCIKNKYDENLFLEIDRKFHLFLIEASGNRFMTQTYNNIRDYIAISAKKALMKKGRAKEVINEHKAILEALSKEDAMRAREALRKHLINSQLTATEGYIGNG